ncbi:MAG: hypothetical protein IJ709_03615 [Selenomonas sp.]|nr:hypothetical protein [Selenomonas sp.]
MDEPILPWERRKDLKEPSRAYERFCAYRDMPYKDKGNVLPEQIKRARSLRKIAKELKVSSSTLRGNSVTYRWQERCVAYDDYIERRNREENEVEIIQMRKLQAEFGRQALAKAARGLLSVKAETMTATEIARLAEIGVKVERLARGEPTEEQSVRGDIRQRHEGKIQTEAVPIDLSRLTGDELNALEDISRKLQVPPDEPDGEGEPDAVEETGNGPPHSEI